MATVAEITIAATPAGQSSGTRVSTDVMVRCNRTTASVITANGTVVPTTLMREYPNRMNKGNWIATLTANNAQDTASTVTSVCSPNGTASTRARTTASAVPTAAVPRKLAVAQA